MKSQAELLDLYLDILAQNPNAAAPDGLDEKMAAFARRLMHSEVGEPPESTAQDRIWQKMMAAAAKPTASAPSAFSPNGHAPSSAPMSIQDLPMEEFMNHSISLVGGRETAPRRLRLNFSMVAAAIVVVVFVGLLAYAGTQLRPDNSFGAVGLQATNTQLPQELTATAAPMLNPANITPTPTPQDPSTGFTLPPYQSALVLLEAGVTVEGSVTQDEPTYFYLIQAQAGDLLEVTIEASDLVSMSYSSLQAPQVGSGSNNSGGGGGGGGGGGPAGQPVSMGTVIPVWSDSAILFSVQNDVGGRPVTYTIKLEEIAVPVLNYGETAAGVYSYENPSHPYLFHDFEGKRGDIVDINMESEVMDGVLKLSHVDDSAPLVMDDDGGYGYNPEILGFQLPRDGIYRIEIYPANIEGVDGAEYQITVSKREAISLENGAAILITLNDKYPARVLSFEGQAGSQVSLSLGYDTASTLVSVFAEQNGQELDSATIVSTNSTQSGGGGSFSGGNLNNTTLEFTLPADGTVNIFLNAAVPNSTDPVVAGSSAFMTQFQVLLNHSGD